MTCPPSLALPLTALKVEKKILTGKSSSNIHPLSGLCQSAEDTDLFLSTLFLELKVSEIRTVSDYGAKDVVLGWSGGVLGRLAVSGTCHPLSFRWSTRTLVDPCHSLVSTLLCGSEIMRVLHHLVIYLQNSPREQHPKNHVGSSFSAWYNIASLNTRYT